MTVDSGVSRKIRRHRLVTGKVSHEGDKHFNLIILEGELNRYTNTTLQIDLLLKMSQTPEDMTSLSHLYYVTIVL